MMHAAALVLMLTMLLLLSSAASAQHNKTGQHAESSILQLKAPKPTEEQVGPDGRTILPLTLKLSAKREGDKAVGTATVTNPLNGTVQASCPLQ